jgi:Ca-activated chloride channel family protein
VDDAPLRLSEIYPIQLPDLFAGEELIIFGRYESLTDDRAGAMRIAGRRAGRQERFGTDVRFPTHDLGNDYLPRLWASRKLGHLARQIRIEGHSEDLEREIRETALRYGLLSEYTAYLVQEPEVVASQNGGAGPTRLQSQNRPGSQANMQLVDALTQAGSAPVAARRTIGREAVMRAKRERILREVAAEADLVALDERVSPRNDSQTRLVAGRWFRLDEGVWIDGTHHDSLPVVEVELYGKTYFQLLRHLPELERWLKAFERVLIAGAGTSVRIVTDSATPVEGDALRRLVREFRGS